MPDMKEYSATFRSSREKWNKAPIRPDTAQRILEEGWWLDVESVRFEAPLDRLWKNGVDSAWITGDDTSRVIVTARRAWYSVHLDPEQVSFRLKGDRR